MMDHHINLAKIKASLTPLAGVGFNLRLLRVEDLVTTLTWRNREDIRHHFIKSDIISWEQHLAWWDDYRAKNDDFVLIIEETEKLNRPVGQVSLYNIDLENDEAEYGRLMIGDNEARGKGLARRATELLIAWAFNRLKIKRIYLEVFKKNTTAINLYRRCGFVAYGDREELYLMNISKKSALSMLKDMKQKDSNIV
jgi:RimJ/RimL family protein N-acetyltransferase